MNIRVGASGAKPQVCTHESRGTNGARDMSVCEWTTINDK